MKNQKYTNELIHETSPYLLQHAHNPVNWQPWGEKALTQAKAENKLLLISIGYSACHWCHVMEHESFEDTEVAKIMNDHFICIKVDREERPDVDHIYMTAVQLLTGRGGWPLNCIALSDGRPIWGGTYFQKENWIQALKAVFKFYIENPKETLEYAIKLQDGIEQNSLIPISGENAGIDPLLLPSLLKKWQSYFDTRNGGTKGAPKFMIPNNWQFLLRAGQQLLDEAIHKQVELTLQKMSFGGLYDQVGGGFARYSTDEIWKVPHFEKMLYDNAQLLHLYAEAYQTDPNPLYQQVVSETIEFLKRELLSPENGFYSALDADSEGEEGKFYTWTKPELIQLLGADFELFSEYFNVNSLGFWEHNQYILMRTEDNDSFAKKHQLSIENIEKKVQNWKSLLLKEREKRIRPGLDDKILTSWNAMTINGLISCYKAFGNPEYLELALANANFLKQKLFDANRHLLHSYKNNQAKISGFLDDYAFVIEAFTTIFEATGQKDWLNLAQQLTKITFQEFYDEQKSIFYFTASQQQDLITRTIEVHDNVIPSSNSVMAKNLFRLSYLLDRPDYLETAQKMFSTVSGNMADYPSGYSNWSQLMLDLTGNHFEVAIIGENAISLLNEFQKNYLPHVIFCAGTAENDLPLLKGRHVSGKTLIYICQNNSCQLPVETIKEALLLISN
ncbi:thymidylate kinase [Aquipluma nitroreducens]|uniref:Thymidylate kinase n=1 Tax=Aquipluma nitroreducens TaxID=2010828 RepID=A0A5K7SCZ4_9BACT|nr:thioredoxin domain-containing protein [Aquipluma nitroreducens]BBE19438.1 thymidylate kinase [Aquipluma nitroreducens]